ncbi:MAG: DUF308 domain-containing protein [Ruminococcus sp.]|nr:DUF308 domain-containing protein [Ruminococcus sp.]
MENVMTMTNGFVELSAMDMCEIDGGVNWWGVASGVLSVAGGCFAIAACVADPEPVSKTYAGYSGACWIASGVTGIIASF